MIGLFPVFHFLTWKLATEDILSNNNYDGGDQVRTGYVSGSRQYRKISFDLPKRHIEFSEYHGQPVDVVTVGDSFSNVCGMGRNYYYQDYIASINNLTVLNIGIYKDKIGDTSNLNPFATLVVLANSGLLEKIKPRYVVLESAERFCVERMAGGIDLDMKADPAFVNDPRHYITYSSKVPKVSFMNDGNFKYLYYQFRYRFSDHPTGMVYVKPLSRPLFSAKKDSNLVFFRDDFESVAKATPETIQRLNTNLNLVADKLRRMGITLYFMPAVDKYGLYSKFILNNKLPKSTFFEELRPLPKRYEFIDTKAILLPELERGERDIFFADDSHWTWKASEKIFTTVRFSGDAARQQ